MSNKLYDFLKKLVQVILPASATAYFALAGIWDLPAPEKVVATIAAVTTFLGVCIGISAKAYRSSDAAFDGSLVVSEPQAEGEPMRFLIDVNEEVEGEIPNRDAISLRVVREPAA